MPSDLTISKLQGTTTPVASTREQEIAASHRKATGLMTLNEFVRKTDETVNQRNIRLLKNMWDSEFRRNPTVATHKEVVTTFKNQLATALGTAGDLTDMVWSVLQHGATRPGGVSDKPLPDISEKIDPFTSETIANLIGGDTEHWSWLPAQFTTPGVGPGEFKTLFGGIRGAGRSSPNKIKRLDEAMKDPGFAQSRYDVDKFAETGWFLTQDGTPRFHIDDSKAVFKWKEKVENHPLWNSNIGESGVIEFKLPEILEHPELFEAYPELRAFPVKLAWTNTSKGLMIRNPNVNPYSYGALVQGNDPRTGEDLVVWLSLDNEKVDVADHVRETLFHELQHTIQAFEGFARGGNTDFGGFIDATRNMGDHVAKLRVFDLIDGGADNIDELGAKLQELGWPEQKIEFYLNNPEVNSYLGASMAYDNYEMEQMRMFNSHSLSDISDKWAWVITNTNPDDSAAAMDTLITKMEAGDRVWLKGQLFRSYEHLYGEAEARLAGTMSKYSFNDIVDRLGRHGFDPNLEQKVVPGMPLTESPQGRANPSNVRVLDDAERELVEMRLGAPSGRSASQEEVVDFPLDKTSPDIIKKIESTQTKLDDMWDTLEEARKAYDERWGKTPWLLLDEDPTYLRRVGFRQGENPEKILRAIQSDTDRLNKLTDDYNALLKENRELRSSWDENLKRTGK